MQLSNFAIQKLEDVTRGLAAPPVPEHRAENEENPWGKHSEASCLDTQFLTNASKHNNKLAPGRYVSDLLPNTQKRLNLSNTAPL